MRIMRYLRKFDGLTDILRARNYPDMMPGTKNGKRDL